MYGTAVTVVPLYTTRVTLKPQYFGLRLCLSTKFINEVFLVFKLKINFSLKFFRSFSSISDTNCFSRSNNQYSFAWLMISSLNVNSIFSIPNKVNFYSKHNWEWVKNSTTFAQRSTPCPQQ